ncbi:MAG: DUF1592 domain-containing protein [Planctomycetota bacterium]
MHRFVFLLLLGNCLTAAADEPFDETVQPFLKKYCVSCHSNGRKAKGGVDFTTMTAANAAAEYEVWESVAAVLEERQMPPDDEPQPTEAEIDQVLSWYRNTLINAVGSHPGFFTPRRLCATEYRNTLRSLFGFDLEVAIIEAEQTVAEKSLVMKLLPTDPPGESGFKNDTHSAPLSTLLWDQYSYLADAGLTELFSKKRRSLLEEVTGPIGDEGLTADQAEAVVRWFVPRALRRPPTEDKLQAIINAVRDASNPQTTLKAELKVVLMSPTFLYRGMLVEQRPGFRAVVDDYELAERLSFFIWADMPDDELFGIASSGQLQQPEIFSAQVTRMLDSPKARNLADDYAVQWLSLDQIAKQSKRVPQAEALKSQPRDFIHYLFAEDRPLLELIDSRTTFANVFTASYYGQDRKQMKRFSKPKGIEVQIVPNQKLTLVHTTSRGGILTMPGILEMNRGPVIRGTWMLERILGDHLPEPPPNVGQVPTSPPGKKLSFRERFEMHRSKPTCAICHDKIDPLGFALQKYNGPDYNANADVDTSGRLPSGETFKTFAELKALLLTTRKRQIVRNIVERTLSYAVCRKLELYDRPTVDTITNRLLETDGTYRQLIHLIADSPQIRNTAFRN